jgi:anti-anti-sigma factor
MMKIDIHAGPQTALLRCCGRLVLGWETETLRYVAKSRPEPYLILDLGGVENVDAAGLGVLVELYCWARRTNKALTLSNPSAPVSRLVALTKLHSVLEIAGHPEADETESRFERRCMTA